MAILLGSAFPADARVITVKNGRDSGVGSLRAAIANAEAGDTITFDPSVRSVVLTTGRLENYWPITIKGPGAKKLTIRRSSAPGTPQFRIFEVRAKLTISGVTIANGFLMDDSAGLRVYYSELIMRACTITGNKGGSGPAINTTSDSRVKLIGCTISDNKAVNGYGGGALSNWGEMTISRSTLARNHAGGSAGAIINSGRLTITNSTIAGNSADGSAGGIMAIPGTAEQPRPVEVRNSIIANNTDKFDSPDYSGRMKSGGWNIIGNTSGMVIGGNTTGNQLNVNPVLGPLQDNGGPTKTRALMPGSPALDQGNSGAATKDQRGLSRPVDFANEPNAPSGDGSDIGAFEVQDSPP